MNTDHTNGKKISRMLLGAVLITAGIAHLSFKRKEFRAQVPRWVPGDVDSVVLISGIAEITLGTALIVPGKKEATIGKIAALFFAAVFPGNIAQYTQRRNSFGLNTDNKRFARLFFQPLLMLWALKSTQHR